MTARDRLKAVAEVYASVTTLASAMTWFSESGDEDSRNFSEQRVKVLFAVPDMLRLEQGGRNGTIVVTDGNVLHDYFGAAKSYAKTRAPGREHLPGDFRPDYPLSGGPAFLFNRIAERVISAEIQGETTLLANESQTHCHVISVMYEPPSDPGFAVAASPITFWADSTEHLILRMEGSLTHRPPAHEETQTSRTALTVNRIAINQAIPPDAFTYSPPPNALDPLGRGGGSVRGGGGGGGSSSDPQGNRFETWHSHEWAGPGTLVETSRLKFQTVSLSFERRITFSDDQKSLEILERIRGPKETTEHGLSIPLE